MKKLKDLKDLKDLRDLKDASDELRNTLMTGIDVDPYFEIFKKENIALRCSEFLNIMENTKLGS
jgi:hypothetical protein